MRKIQFALLFALSVLLAGAAVADGSGWDRHDAVREAVGDATPQLGQLRMQMPSVSEDGSAVPLEISIDHPMTDGDYIESIRVFATANPNPEVVDFYLTPLMGRAEVSSRVRVNESQTLYAVAHSSSGDVFVASSDVRVTVGGCLMTSDDDIAEFGQPRVAPPRNLAAGQPGEVRTLVTHPMETGLREGPDGELLPRRMIDTLIVEFEGDTVLTVKMHTAVSENPYMRFFMAPETSGNAVFRWTEEESGDTVEEQMAFNLS
ncbi:MAG: thiosulfate oxidation carrier complex protein SoxZ [Natronospirillum sp.]|uniref:thiosulfate oxidation carrier protein SoxY n=1 Tax=Natronospirillum sp. TaxID=2812955 RepID=UPI0025DF3D1C|nr:thiosulfate oxidation carrier protein SoxY [Natronospirillum sp.]MCH8551216.1 thiosulfate oxidation carrier complex protein SoxZ [Natronospirillum sp.]